MMKRLLGVAALAAAAGAAYLLLNPPKHGMRIAAVSVLDMALQSQMNLIDGGDINHARKVMELSAVLNPRTPMQSVVDLKCPGPHGDIPLRVYTPKPSSNPQPAVLFFHGGGWTIGNVQVYDSLCRELALKSGCIFVFVEYRLAPEHKFPIPVDECYAATRWVRENAETINADPLRLAVAGDSAGGNMAAVVCQMARDYASNGDDLLQSLRTQVLIYPATKFRGSFDSIRENANAPILTLALMTWFWQQYLKVPSDGDSPYASPLNGDCHGLPSALVLTAKLDPLASEGEAYASKLDKSGVSTRHIQYKSVHFFVNLGLLLPEAHQATTVIGEHLRTAFSLSQ